MLRFIRNSIITMISLLVVISTTAIAQDNQLTRITPEQAGFSSEKLIELGPYLENVGSSCLLIISDGKVFYEWGDIHKKFLIHSIRKALLNSLYGIYIEKGIIDTSATLSEIGIDDIEPGLTELEKSAKVIDLLKSRSGIYHKAAAESPGMVESRPKRGSSKPGEAYYYNNWDFNTLGAIFEKMTGKSIFTAFYEDVAQPIGMLQYKGLYDSINTSNPNVKIPETDGYYQYEPSKSKYPAYHFRMSAYDLGLYGILYANKGKWKGKQIVPEKWIEYSTEPLSIVNEKYGRARGILWGVDLKYACIQHAGYGGQLLRIYPKSKIVFVHFVNTEDGGTLFPEDNIYPIFGILFGAKID